MADAPAPSLAVGLAGIAFWCEYAPDWPGAQALLRERSALPEPAATWPAPQWLQGAERRRAAPLVAISLEVARQAFAGTGLAPADAQAIFASSHGDVSVTDALCQTLAHDPALLSPTRFHHSVHNAAAGYWGIATGNTRAAIALAAHRYTLGAALLETTLCVGTGTPAALMVSADLKPPSPMDSLAPASCSTALALVLTSRDDRWPTLRLSVCKGPEASAGDDASPLEQALAGSYQPDVGRWLRALAFGTRRAERDEPAAHACARLALSPALHLRLTVEGPAA